jgi:multidrug efflux system membrane fusion protein
MIRLTLLVAAATLTACGGSSDDLSTTTDDGVTAVRLAAVTTDTVRVPITATGSVGARDVVTLSFKIGGIVAAIGVDEGDRARRGTVLARLDTREIDALVAKARAALDKALRDSARVARLYTDSVATLAQWQDASTGVAVARADLAAAQVNQEYAVITAPDDGAILKRWVTPGALVSIGAPVLTLGGAGRGIVFRAGLADRDAVRVRVGDSATVRFDAYPGQVWRGRVSQRSAAADPRSGTYAVEVTLQDAGALPDGLVGVLTLQPRDVVTGRVVPLAALLEGDGDQAAVYSVASDRAVRHAVRVGPFVGADRVVVLGLDTVDAVVVAGAPYLTPGAPVRIVP